MSPAHSTLYTLARAAESAWLQLSELLAEVGPVPCGVSDPAAWFPTDPEIASTAARACLGCDARVECEAYAVAAGESHGVWGGRVFDRPMARRLEVAAS